MRCLSFQTGQKAPQSCRAWHSTLPRKVGPQRRHRSAARATSSGTGTQRGVIILPGLANNAADYKNLSEILRQRGMDVEVAPITRLDWSRNAAALTDVNWWKGTLKPRPAVDWYMDKLNASMQALKRRVDGGPITMLTHSAGGWLGRVYMLDFGSEGIDHFVSLGSPHQPPPKGIIDQTRGILTWCSDSCPGAYHPNVKYTSIAGRFIKGAELSGEGELLAKIAGIGYQQVCGQADVFGDVIVPEPSAHLGEGAESVNLEGVFHSPIGEKLPFFGPWYGSASVVPRWVHYLDSSEPAPLNESSAEDSSLAGSRKQ
uniref:GPI inositol-deacylase n=1 Tax=Dunaliella tertiolecta TaxID=3047 RepID=A0A7S3VNG6_DUNTE